MSDQFETAPRPPLPSEPIQLGIVPLRPLTLPDFVSGTAQALRRNAGALLGVGLLVAVVGEVLVWLISTLAVGGVTPTVPQPGRLDWESMRPLVVTAAIRGAVAGLLGLVLLAVVNVVVPRAVFGHTTGVGAALRQGLPKVPRAFGATVAAFLVMLPIGFLLGLVLFTGPAGVVLALPLIAGMIYLSVCFTFSSSVAVVEDIGWMGALRRSRELVLAVGWWRVCGLVVAAQVVTYLLTTVLTTLFGRISGESILGDVLAAVVAGALLTPALVTFLSLVYVDHRCRSEGVEGLWRTAG